MLAGLNRHDVGSGPELSHFRGQPAAGVPSHGCRPVRSEDRRATIGRPRHSVTERYGFLDFGGVLVRRAR